MGEAGGEGVADVSVSVEELPLLDGLLEALVELIGVGIRRRLRHDLEADVYPVVTATDEPQPDDLL